MLAIKSSRGESIAFHYPPEGSSRVLDTSEQVDHDTDGDSDLDDGGFVALPRSETFDRRLDGHLPTIQERETSQDETEDSWSPPWKNILGLDSSLLVDILTPQLSDHKFEMWIDNVVFLGCPVQLRQHNTWQIAGQGLPDTAKIHAEVLSKNIDHSASQGIEIMPETKNGLKDPSLMTTFHLVFALEASIDDCYHERISHLFEHVVHPLTQALAQEQNKNEYVWTQCETLRDLRRRGERDRASIATLWQQMLSVSELASVIKDTFEAISEDNVAQLRINKERHLSLYVPRSMTSDSIPEDTILEHPLLNSAVSFGISMDEADPIILPYYALLLLEDPEKILAKSPQTTDSSLRRLLSEVRPQKDFHSLAEALNVPVQEIIITAQDLIRWRCALPIPPLHERNVYTISPTADKSRLPQQIPAFAKAFPAGPSLPNMLASLSVNAEPYAKLVPEGHLDLYMEILAWLMRSGWLIQMRTFVSVKVRAEIKAAVTKQQTSPSGCLDWDAQRGEVLHDELFQDSVIADPYNATERERAWLDKLASYHPVADAALFLRACKYFNGKHAVEKIAVREGIDPRSLRRLLDVFDEDLIKSYSW